MAKTWCGTFAGANTGVSTANIARYWRMFGDMYDAATATGEVYVTWRGAGTITDLQVFVATNTRATPWQIQLYVNGAAVGPIINVPATTPGIFTWGVGDALAIADGDQICLRTLNGTGTTGGFALKSITWAFEGTGGITTGMRSATVGGFVTASSAFYFTTDGDGATSGVEALVSPPAAVAGVYSNIQGAAATNTYTVPVAVLLRKNSAASALSASFPASNVGPVEDTVNTVAVAVNDTFNFSAARSSAGSGSLNLNNVAVRFTSNSSAWEIGGGYAASVSSITNTTDSFYAVMGNTAKDSLTEADEQLIAPFDMYIYDLRAGVRGVAMTTTASLTLRVNGVDTPLVATFPTGVADPTCRNNADVVFVPKGALVCLKLIPPLTGTRIMNYIYLAIDTAPPPAVLTSPATFSEPRPRRRRLNNAFVAQPAFTTEQLYRPPVGFGLDRPPRRGKRRLRDMQIGSVIPLFPAPSKKRVFIYVQT